MSDKGGANRSKGPMTPSNVITITRILLVPVFVAAFLAPWPEWFGFGDAFSDNWKAIIAAAIFVVISATDWLDGYLARSRNEITDFGKFMDPLADKILVSAALICLVELGDLPSWVVLIILAREFIVSGVRMMAASKGEVIAASMIGKFKTVFQMAAIVLFTVKGSHMFGTLGEAFTDFVWLFSWLVMLVALGLTIASMIDYLYKARTLIGFTFSKQTDQNGINVAPAKQEVEQVAKQVVENATRLNMTVSTAESLTGGMIGEAITSIPGSSAVFKGAVVSYANQVKHDVLGVDEKTLDEIGAVSQPVAMQMAERAKMMLGSDVAVSVTGLAGPDGDEFGNPVGTVWIGFSTAQETRAEIYHFSGNRDDIRLSTTYTALALVADYLNDQNALICQSNED